MAFLTLQHIPKIEGEGGGRAEEKERKEGKKEGRKEGREEAGRQGTLELGSMFPLLTLLSL